MQVDMKLMPPNAKRRMKPDFMATAPRLMLEHTVKLEDDEDELEQNLDPVRTLDPEGQPVRYYESPKVLGQLFRAIDEIEFLREMQTQYHFTPDPKRKQQTLMSRVWSYVCSETRGIIFSHERDEAQQIRER